VASDEPPDELRPVKKSDRRVMPPSDLEYQRWWVAFQRLGEKAGIHKFRAAAGISMDRARYALTVGWPGYPALRDREVVADPENVAAVRRVALEAETRAVAAVAETLVPRWEDAARKLLEGLARMGDALNTQAENLAKAAGGASFVSYRRVPDVLPDGTIRRDEKNEPIMILKPYVSAHAVASASARLTAAGKDHATLVKATLSSLAPGERPQVLSGPPALVLMMPDSDDLQEPKPGAG
jgi:hypothetical protein